MPSRAPKVKQVWLRHEPSHVQAIIEPRVDDTTPFHIIPRVSEAAANLERSAMLGAEVFAPRDAEFNVRVGFLPSAALMKEFSASHPRLKKSKSKSALDNTYYGPEPESSYVLTVRIYNEDGALEAKSFCSFIHNTLWRTYSINCDLLDTEHEWPLLKHHESDAEQAPLCMGARVECEVRRTVIYAFDDEEGERREREMEEVDHDPDDGPPVATFCWLRKDPSTRTAAVSESPGALSVLSSIDDQPSQSSPTRKKAAPSPAHPKHILVPDSAESSTSNSSSVLSSEEEDSEPSGSPETPPRHRSPSPFIPPEAARAGSSRKRKPAAKARVEKAAPVPSTSTPASQRPKARPSALRTQRGSSGQREASRPQDSRPEVSRHVVSPPVSSVGASPAKSVSQEASTSAAAAVAPHLSDDIVSAGIAAAHEQAHRHAPHEAEPVEEESHAAPHEEGEWQDFGDDMNDWPGPSATNGGGGAQDNSGDSVMLSSAPLERTASRLPMVSEPQPAQQQEQQPSHSTRSQSNSSALEVAAQVLSAPLAAQPSGSSHTLYSESHFGQGLPNLSPRARTATRTASTEVYSPQPRPASMLSDARVPLNGAVDNRFASTSFRDHSVLSDARAPSMSAPAQRADSVVAHGAAAAYSNGIKRDDSFDDQQWQELAALDKHELVSQLLQLKKEYDGEQRLGDGFYQTTMKQREELIRLKESHAREQSRVKEEHASEMRRQASALSRCEAELAALQLSTKETISKLESELDGSQHELGNARAELRSLRSKVERLETPDRDAVRRKRAEELERLVAEERMEGSSKRLRTG